ncbi:MAG TPA: NADP-dependent isocitrate dehydrogenase [Cytophagales bacterium]|nr:NADP-dependent isocitrate dehydrogenase [Cytophagales bacterium]HAA22148.1 NADP-dependent isocitrate dehydrogenase [Cytophagales bacterium]HAP63500.1 NADP-dependent isocitrate dehydrogenase [Cytophagales bacterium]
MADKRNITVAFGDGIGPEIMQATLDILDAAGTPLIYDQIEIGEKVYLRGITSGIEESSWDSLRRNKVFLKAPITTPQGGGYKSLNVTTRKTLGLFANVRPIRSFYPFIKTHHPIIDMVIIRENEEDLYAGIEHQQTQEVVQALKLISHPGSERIIRYAFEYAKAYGRKKVTCLTKDNIMKHTDGLFHKLFDQIGEEYPNIKRDHMIIDIGSAIIADKPGTLDVVVTENLYGDIVSDIAAQITGSVGLGGSSNVGKSVAMFEAIHGSAPDIAGDGIANPSGLLNGAVMMLVHLGMPDYARKVRNAWLKTIEQGIHTRDIYNEEISKRLVNTKGFTDAVISNLGEVPLTLAPARFEVQTEPNFFPELAPLPRKKKELVGVDVFIDWDKNDRNPDVIGDGLKAASSSLKIQLKMITNRGVKVYPDGLPETYKTDHWRCRFTATEAVNNEDVVTLLSALHTAGYDVVKTENLYTFDGERGYSLAQGE